jgi:hypothetical protein
MIVQKASRSRSLCIASGGGALTLAFRRRPDEGVDFGRCPDLSGIAEAMTSILLLKPDKPLTLMWRRARRLIEDLACFAQLPI